MFQGLLDKAFSSNADVDLIRGVSEGIFLADSTLESAGFLKSMIGQDLRGHLRRAGILFRLDEMSRAGDLPFATTMTKMPRGNWHWLEIRSENFTSHVVRTEAPEAFPVDSPTRQDDRLTNQYDLFYDTQNVVSLKRYTAWLTFGAAPSGALGHLCWGMPNANEDVWLARTNVLQRAKENEAVVHSEVPTKVTTLKFREHVEESLKSSEAEYGKKTD